LLGEVAIFFIYRLGGTKVYQKQKKGVGFHLEGIGDDVITLGPVTSLGQIARHRMAFFEIKLTCLSFLLENIK
jgi:hypothetical protein